jgi:hypothetical protein
MTVIRKLTKNDRKKSLMRIFSTKILREFIIGDTNTCNNLLHQLLLLKNRIICNAIILMG